MQITCIYLVCILYIKIHKILEVYVFQCFKNDDTYENWCQSGASYKIKSFLNLCSYYQEV